MTILENYLYYLQEGIPIAAVGKFIGSNVKSSLEWSAGIATALIALKSGYLLFNQAARKCGGGVFKKQTPGFKICVVKEQNVALQSQINAYTQILLKCSSNENPTACKQKYNIEIEKAKNKIEINQNKIKQLSGLEEQLGFLMTAGKFAAGMGIMMAADKAVFLANRTFLAMFNQASRKCGVYKDGPERSLCIAKSKVPLLITKLSKLKSIEVGCNKEKDPIKCKEKINKQIQKIIQEIKIEKDNVVSFTNEAEAKKREDQLKMTMKGQKRGG